MKILPRFYKKISKLVLAGIAAFGFSAWGVLFTMMDVISKEKRVKFSINAL